MTNSTTAEITGTIVDIADLNAANSALAVGIATDDRGSLVSKNAAVSIIALSKRISALLEQLAELEDQR